MLLGAYAPFHNCQTLAIMAANAANGCPSLLIWYELNLTAVRAEILWFVSNIFCNPIRVES